MIDCRTAGSTPLPKIPVGSGYQVPFAAQVRAQAEIKTAAVGIITNAHQAEEIISSGKADLVLMVREGLLSVVWRMARYFCTSGTQAVVRPPTVVCAILSCLCVRAFFFLPQR